MNCWLGTLSQGRGKTLFIKKNEKHRDNGLGCIQFNLNVMVNGFTKWGNVMAVSKQKLRIIGCYFVLMVWQVFAPAAANINALVMDADFTQVALDNYASILIDDEKTLQITDFTKHSTTGFQPITMNTLGFSAGTIWLHFKLNWQEQSPSTVMLELDAPILDKVSFYTVDSQGQVLKQSSGDRIAYSQRLIDHRNPVFFITGEDNKVVDYYLSLESNGPIQIPLTLWSNESFISYLGKSQLLFGAYYSLMIVLFMVSFYAFILLKEQIFFRYSLYLLSFLLFQMSSHGVAFRFLWGEFPEYASQLNTSIIGIVIIAALWFSSGFLKLKQHSVTTYRLFQLLQLFTVACVFMVWTGLYQVAMKLMVVCGITLVPVFTLAAIQALRHGYKPARYFSLAWAALMTGIFAAGLRYAGIVPANFFTLHAMQISSTLEMVILMLALVDRFNMLREEKLKAEEATRDAVFKLNHRLETMVSERTHALIESNERLHKLARQDSLTGLLNHNASIQELDKALSSARRYNHAVAVIMLDIDHFKSFNDNYGHLAGDDILKTIADVISSNLRETDSCGRYGGEEFILTLTHAELSEIKALSERIRESVAGVGFLSAPGAKATVSMGVVICYPTQCENHSSDRLIAAADTALYKAKNQGRDQVCFAPHLHLSSST